MSGGSSGSSKEAALKYELDLTGLGYDESAGVWRAKSGMNYSFVFAYEQKFFNEQYLTEYFNWGQNYWHICIYYAILYVVVIHAGQHWMKDRTRYDMRKALAAWNLVLALFSTMGSIRLLPDYLHTLRTHGFVHSFCVQDYAHGVSACWIALFVGSKFAELLDTFFIVIRKQKLIFLHWYHHTTVLVYCWYATHDLSSTGRVFALVNFSVHSIMYSYYAFRAFRFNVPKYIMIAITTGQITQMVLGVVVNTWAFWIKTHGGHCHVSYSNLRFCFFIFLTYLFLFSYFFYETYIKKGGRASSSSSRPVAVADSSSSSSKASSSLVNARHHVVKKNN